MARNTVEVLINMKKSGTGAPEATNELKGLLSAVKAMGAAFGAMKTAQAAYALAKLGAEAARTRTAFTAISGGATEAERRLTAMQRATRGAVSEQAAMASASKLMQMGLASNAEELERVSGMAVRLGSAMGKDATGAIEEFSLMLANQSIPRLDTFGISSGRVRARMEELRASTAGVSREAAFMQAVMEEGGAAMERLGPAEEDAALAAERLEARWADLKTMAGEILAPAMEKVAGALTDAMEATITQQREIDQLTQLFGQDTAMINQWAAAGPGGARAAATALAELRAEMDALVVGPSKALMESQMQAAGVFSTAGGAAEGLRAATAAAAGAQWDLSASASQVAVSFGEMKFDDKTLWKMAMASGASLESLAGLAQVLGIASDAEINATLQTFGLVEAFGQGEVSAMELATGYTEIGLTAAEAEARSADLERAQTILVHATGMTRDRVREASQAMRDAGGAMQEAGRRAGPLGDSFGGVSAAMATAAAHAQTVREQMDRIPRDITVSYHSNYDDWVPPPVGAPGEWGGHRQAGGLWPGGVGWVGEGGPELAILPRGTRIIPHYEAAQAVRNMNDNRSWSRGGDTIIVNDQLAAAMLLAERGRSIERRIARGL